MLQMEIGKTLLGDSLYSAEDLKEAINVIKERIADGEEKLEKLESERNLTWRTWSRRRWTANYLTG